MKKLFSLLLVLSLLLCGCGGNGDTTEPTTEATAAPTTEATAAPTTEAVTEPTIVPTEPTTEPTEPPVPTDPLTGETLDAPYTGRVFAISINNISSAIPHYGVSSADLYFEMYVNDYTTRGLALYSNVAEVESIGSVRSLRYNFTEIAQAYNAVVVHAKGSDSVLADQVARGVNNISAGHEEGEYFFWDWDRLYNQGYNQVHCLFVYGDKLVEFAESKGFAVTQEPDVDYGLHFAETPASSDGEAAQTVTINFRLNGAHKVTTMVYDEETSLYVYNQYNKEMIDYTNKQPEAFKNVIVMFCEVKNEGVYHNATLTGEGEGYFACDGKIIPIRWYRDSDEDCFHYTLPDGTPLEMGVGSSYIAIIPLESDIVWE